MTLQVTLPFVPQNLLADMALGPRFLVAGIIGTLRIIIGGTSDIIVKALVSISKSMREVSPEH